MRVFSRDIHGAACWVVFVLLALAGFALAAEPIDRHALVTRHNPILREFDAQSPLSVGNGRFAFTADVTGLQTFAEAYEETTPLGTLSEWGWHTTPNPDGWSFDKYKLTPFDSHGRAVGYADIPGGKNTPEVNYLRENPHRLHLGRIGFQLTKSTGDRATPADIKDIAQRLDLWRGLLVSHFRFAGEPVDVETVCHPTLDLVAVRVKSPLVASGRLGIELEFPYGTGDVTTADWDHPNAHRTQLSRPRPNAAQFARVLDNDHYFVAADWSPAGKLAELGNHRYVLTARPTSDTLEFVCRFTPDEPQGRLPTFDETRAAAADHWKSFWSTGGAIDLSASSDPRWQELERRIVLSQYLTAIQSVGRYPPQETGLTFNSWYGKFHLEMHWWHAVQFALWNRIDLLERSLDYYRTILPQAQQAAHRQGYEGARWPKMTDPRGVESPSTVGPFLIWQQPHPIYYAELCYRAHGDRATLEKYRDVVFETAEFMASFAAWDEAGGRYVLGPPLECAQEIFPKDRTFNPTFELTYWRWGLETAQRWRERLKLKRDEKWDHVLAHSRAAGRGRGQVSVHRKHARQLHESALGPRPSVGHGRAGHAARPRYRPANNAAYARLGGQKLELARHVGLGLPDAGDVCGPRGRAESGRGFLVARYAQECLPHQRAQLPASRAVDLSAGQRRAALGRGDDGGRLGRGA